ncbi:polysaccharide pyruvyl transferase family protein [soil metagenome]
MTAVGGEAPADNRDHVNRLRGEVDSHLAALLEPDSEVAFVNFPNLRNVGDSAIWLGARETLDRIGVRVRYQAEPATYRRRLLASSVGERGTILVQGGGNLGDVYPHQHRIRKKVLGDFPKARVIQLPQSVWFRSEERANEFRRLAEGHADYTLMLRERRSFEWAEAKLDVPLALCPDLAFGLGPLPRREADLDLLWLMRRGRESRGAVLPEFGPGEVRADWFGERVLHAPEPRRLRLWLAGNRRLTAAMHARGGLATGLWRPQAATYAPIARHRLAAGNQFLARGRVIVTDRLHGHVLAMLLGIPHVLLDNIYGKSRALWETWTSESPLAQWADDPAAAQRLARDLLELEGPG